MDGRGAPRRRGKDFIVTMRHLRFLSLLAALALTAALGLGTACARKGFHTMTEPTLYDIDTPVQSRSISFENPTGAPGQGGQAASNLGVGRKGHPAEMIQPGQTVTLCDIEGPGAIRHIWVTTARMPKNLLGMVIRGYWEGEDSPSIEAPVGCFFGFWNGMDGCLPYQSAVHSVNAKAGMNIWIPMPFAKNARFTLTNESDEAQVLFYQMDYTVGDALSEPFGRLHVLYRRENPTTLAKDFEILPRREGSGRYLGCVLGVHTLEGMWFGEGEFKAYLDGDTQFPTICGTGVEDYVLQSWGLQTTPFRYAGTFLHSIPFADNYNRKDGYFAFYRWHIKDPIYWKKDARITIQQLGWTPTTLKERQDDWSATTFWYEPTPSAPLPPMPDYAARIAGFDPEMLSKVYE